MTNEQLEKNRHSLSHLMTMSVLELYPNAGLGVGPTIENGFYQDYDLPESLSPEVLPKIEEKMRDLINQKLNFVASEASFSDALDFYKNDPYKTELINELKEKGEAVVSFYDSGDFHNLCKGPHVGNTSEIDPDSFKLTKIAGAYWKGSEKNKMLTRVYGVAFGTKEELDDYLKRLSEAEKRDHRVIGKDYFLLDPVVGLGLAMWKPKGALLWRTIEDFWYQKHLENGYDLVRSPHIGSRALWETSGHWNFYNDSMYPVLEVSKSLKEYQNNEKGGELKEEYLLKPMNCPFHVRIYKSEPHSYKSLPYRWAECGTVYRYEKSGELSGLTRVRGFTQDDAHIICRKDQVEDELKRVAIFIQEYFQAFGFKDYKVYLSVRDPKNKDKYAGNDEGWEFTEAVLEKVAKELGLDYVRQEGEAAFYGPKIDYKIKDAIGREWQCSTLQFDFNLPERFDMTYTNSEGQDERPYMLHRALMGSFERFMGLLIEHYIGAFPLWLSPEQVKILPVSEKFTDYATEVMTELKKAGIRVVMDNEGETLGKRIRAAEQSRVPYTLVIGEKEASARAVAVRKRGVGDLGVKPLEEFVTEVVEENRART